jgi:LL-diaminopimelate aminotransferase
MNNEVYRKRRDKVVAVLNEIGVPAVAPKGAIYIWTPIPNGYTSAEFAQKLLDEANVVVTPGNGYGSGGEGYIRLSLTISDDQIDEGLRRLSQMQSTG